MSDSPGEVCQEVPVRRSVLYRDVRARVSAGLEADNSHCGVEQCRVSCHRVGNSAARCQSTGIRHELLPVHFYPGS